jgi:hypothetical protein
MDYSALPEDYRKAMERSDRQRRRGGIVNA